MSEFMPENIEQHGPRQAEKRNDPEQDAERKKPELLRGPESVSKSRNGKTAEKCTGQNPRRRNQKDRYDLLEIANGYDPLGRGPRGRRVVLSGAGGGGRGGGGGGRRGGGGRCRALRGGGGCARRGGGGG